ncbi:MAG: serine hydrolase [Caulobacteraceae bacterium]|nr:serine hydrolase [Caulobacteraceae bacterium]
MSELITIVELQARTERLLTPYLRPGGPGVVVGVARDGITLLQCVFGAADVMSGAPLTLETQLPIASVTKHMTAIGAEILAEEGLLDLDAPVGNYVEGLELAVGRPTLRQLMTHQSGLRCHLDVQFLSGRGSRPDGFAMRTIKRMHTVNTEPGELQVYGNTGFHLVSRAIEAAAGCSFARFMEARVFGPLGLTHTVLAQNWAPGSGNAALYAAEGEEWRDVGDLRHESLGEGGVSSRLDDMMSWARALRTEDPRLPKAAWTAVKFEASTSDGMPSGYGLGLVVGRHRGVETIGHGGMIYGATSALLTAPAHGVDIVVLANMNLPAEAIARDLLVAVLDESVLTPAAAPARTQDWPGLQEGLFLANALVARFLDLGGALAISLQGSPPLPLMTGVEGLWLQGVFGPISILLPDGPGGDRLEVRMGGETHAALRTRNAPPHGPALAREVVGTYVCAEIESAITLLHGDDAIGIRTQGPYGTVEGRAIPITAEILLAEVPFSRFLLTLRRESGQVTGLVYDTPRTRALPFLRIS